MASTISRVEHGAAELSPKTLDAFQRSFDSDPRYRQSMNAVCATAVNAVAKDRRVVSSIDHSYSDHLPEGKATAQNSSGRCWLFAALNTLRIRTIEALKLPEEWELSQNYLMFYDKLEKANYFLESIIQTVDEPTGSRLLDWLLASPIQDGGQWHMFTNLVKKYGVVPKSAMPETESSSNTGQMNGFVTGKLREFAWRLRKDAKGEASTDDLRARKVEMMAEIYRLLAIHAGEPPKDFEWQWRDKDKNFIREGRLTPQEFYARHIGVALEDQVCLIHCPQSTKRYNESYTIKFLGNVVGGHPIQYINVEIDVLREAASKQIRDGSPVWFGCDVGKYLDRDLGVLNLDLFQYDLVYGTDIALGKADRLDYGHSLMTHAMVLTGVDLDDDGKPRKWRVENSWGEKGGDKGFLSMSDAWFDEYLYEVVVDRRHLPASVLACLKKESIPLEPWDPMGSLAG